MSIDLTPQQLERLKGILALHLPNPLPVLVFGSRGNGQGKAHRASDIDVALITLDRLPVSVMTNLREAFAASDLPYGVDLVDWSATDKTFQQKILAAFTVLSPDFFISYTAPDLGWAQWLAYQLEDAGYSTVLQAWDFKAGENFVERMHEAARFARFTLGVLSPDYLSSDWCKAEMLAALAQDPLGKKQKFIGVKVASCNADGLLAGRVYIDLLGKGEQVAKQYLLSEMAKALNTGRNKPDTSPAFPGAADESSASPSVLRRVNSKVSGTRFPNTATLVINLPIGASDASHFVGRQAIYQDIQQALLNRDTKANAPVVISGGAGYGKSTLALHLIQGVAFDFDAVCWVNAETEISLSNDYANLAGGLGLGLPQGMPQPEQIKAVKAHLDQSSRVLLILDNAEDHKLIAPYLPAAIGGVGSRALLTSRLQRWDGMRRFNLEVFTPDEAHNFWIKFGDASWVASAEEITSNETLAKELGYLPLALRHAAAYICNLGLSPSSYLERWRKEKNRIALMDKGHAIDHPHSLFATLQLSFNRIKEHSPAAYEWIVLCAMLAPEDIPIDLFFSSLCNLSTESKDIYASRFPALMSLAKSGNSDLAWDEIRLALHSLALMQFIKTNASQHRLTKEMLRLQLPLMTRAVSWMLVFEMFSVLLPGNPRDILSNVDVWPVYKRLAPHALTWLECMDQEYLGKQTAKAQNICTAKILMHFAPYFSDVAAQYVVGENLALRAVQACELGFGVSHPQVAAALTNLGRLYRDLQKLELAKQAHLREITIFQKTLGEDHFEMSTALNNLALVLEAMAGDVGEIESLYLKAFRIRERICGVDSVELAKVKNNLGMLYRGMGRLREAEKLHQQALAVQRNKLGDMNPDVADSLCNLAAVYQTEDRFMDALPLLYEDLNISKLAFGKFHPKVAITHMNLANVFFAMSQPHKATPHLVAALEIKRAVFGEEHPETQLVNRVLSKILKI